MDKRNAKEFNVIEKIYNGEISYCDKKPLNNKLEKLFNEVAVLLEQNDDKVVEEIIDKYTEIISLTEVEAFAKGMAFMEELRADINKVLV